MELLEKWRDGSTRTSEERKAKMLKEWNATPRFPDFVLSKRLLEAADGGREEGGEIVIDLFDQLKIENYPNPGEKLAELPSPVSDQALILPFFSDEVIAISEVTSNIVFTISAYNTMIFSIIHFCRCQKGKITRGTLWRSTVQVT